MENLNEVVMNTFKPARVCFVGTYDECSDYISNRVVKYANALKSDLDFMSLCEEANSMYEIIPLDDEPVYMDEKEFVSDMRLYLKMVDKDLLVNIMRLRGLESEDIQIFFNTLDKSI